MRRLGVIALALPLLAACGSSKHVEDTTPTRTPEPMTLRPPPLAKPSFVHVIVQDGDLSRPVRGALVKVSGHPDRTDHKGVAKIKIPHRGRLILTIRSRGYDPYKQRLQFTNRPVHAVRVFQTKLQWPMYGAVPTRTQAQQYIRIRPPFKLIWSRPVGALIEFPAIVDDEVAFVSNFHGTVTAISMRNGKLVWRRYTPHGMMAASPALYKDQLIVHGMDGHVWVLNRFNGKVLWRYYTGSPIESSPVVVDGIDYFGDWGGTVYALNLRTHRARWTYHTGNKITSSASYMNGTIFIGDYGGRLLSLGARTGRLHWSAGVNGRIYGTPAVASGRVFAPSSDGNTMNAFTTSGHHLWTINTGAYVYSSPAVWRGRVYFGSYTGDLYCVSARTGSVLWRFSTAGSIQGAPTVVGGIVYFATRQHRMY